MSYTQLALLSVPLVILFDFYITKSSVLSRKSFWNAYAIMLFFQIITNWWLTSREIVSYSPDAIWGPRIASAPVQDLLFGFSLILITLDNWVTVTRKK